MARDPNDWRDLGASAPGYATEDDGDWSDLARPRAAAKTKPAAAPARKPRTAGERFGENVEDATARNPTVATVREAYNNPFSGMADGPGGLPAVGPRLNRLPSLLDTPVVGPAVRAGAGVAGVVGRRLGLDPPALLNAEAERRRREEYEARSAEDPFYNAPGGFAGKAAAAAATAGGQIVGAFTDPQNLVSPGRTAITRAAGAGAINAAGDVQTQTADVGSGVQDEYRPGQTAAAAIIGPVISGTQDLARAGGRFATRKAGEFLERLDGSTTARGRNMDTDWSDLAAEPQRPAPKAAPQTNDWSDLGAPTRAPEAAPTRPPRKPRPASAEAQPAAAIKEILPGATITSGLRTVEQNAKVGGVPNSYHLTDRARDIVPPKGVSMEEAAERLRASGLYSKVINEGDHIHVQWDGDGAARADAAGFEGVPDRPLDRVPDRGESEGFEVDFAADERARATAGQAPERTGPQAPGARAEPDTGSAGGGRFFDEGHARLYDLGQRALKGEELDPAEIDALTQDVGRYFDWTDAPLNAVERRAWQAEGRIAPGRMVEAAKDFVRAYDAPEGQGPHVRFYDPDRLDEVMEAMAARQQPQGRGELPEFPERLDLGSDNQRLSDPSLSRERLGMFAGRGARTADRSTLTVAEGLERQGRDAEAIRQRTGWFRGDDNEWRFELADDTAEFRTAPARGFFGQKEVGLQRLYTMADKEPGGYLPSRLDEIIDHPRLFEAYPQLRRIKVSVDDMDAHGHLSGGHLVLGKRALSNPEHLRGVILHELQHAIQRREGFNLGAATDRLGLEMGGYGDALEARQEWLRSRGYKTDTAAFETYQRSAGEIEARNTQNRRHMSDAARMAHPPEATRDIPRSESLVVQNEPGIVERFRRYRNATQEAADDGKRAAIDLSAYGDQIRGARTGGNVTGARPSEARPVGQGSPDYARQTVSQLAERLRKSLGVTQRQGRLTVRGPPGSKALGEFDPRTGVVRTRAARDAINELAHEAGHKLQHRRTRALAAAIEAHGEEIDRLAYAGANPRHQREEGFAEFFKAYLLNPEEARLRAPNFFDAFEEALAKDLPVVASDLRAIQRAYGDLLQGAALDVATASVAYTGRPGKLGQLVQAYRESGVSGVILQAADEAYRGIWDRKHPFNVWLRQVQNLAKEKTGSRLSLEAAENPYVLARQADHAFGMGQSDIVHGVTPYQGVDPEGPSIPEIYRKAFGSREPTPEEDARFGAYLISRRMRHEWDRYYRGELENAPDKVEHDKAFHERVVEDAERQHPEWKEAGELATEWNRRHWKLWFDAGFIGKQTYETGIKDHPDYVPLQRDMTDKTPTGSRGRAAGVGQFAGGADAFVGSQRDIIHPMVTMARRAFEARAAIARNEVIRSMWSAAQKAGDEYGHLIEELPAKEWELIKLDAMEALEAVAKAIGIGDRDASTFRTFQTAELEGAIQVELFRQREFSPRKGEAVVFMWKDGRKTPLLLPEDKLGRDLFTAISGMTKDTRALWEEVAAASAAALRLGITGMPEFAVKTGIRDQLAAAILTDVRFVPYLDTLRGMKSRAKNDTTAKRYMAAGGLRGGVNVAAIRRPFPRNDVEAAEQLERLRGNTLRSRAKARGVKLRDGGELFSAAAHIVDFGDTATRIGVFRKAVERAKARGLSDYQAVVEARHLSADFFDPTRHGGWPAIVQVARTVPFFNSGLQGPDVAVRVIRHAFAKPETLHDKRAFRRAWWALSMLGATATLGATLALAWSDDPDWQNINDQVRATHWPLWKRANGEWVMYPKSFELGMPSNLVERGIEWLKQRDPRVLERIRKDLMNTVVPTRDAPILAVPFQAAANRDRHGKPIVPEHLRGKVEPRYQVNAWTSETAKKLAGNVVSPAILEHYITGFLGTGGRDALRVGDAAISVARGDPRIKGRLPDNYMTRNFVRRTARGSDAEENFWKLAGQAGSLEKAANTLRLVVREGDDAKVAAYLKRLSPEQRTYAISQVLLGGKIGKAHPLARARTAIGVIGDIRRESRKGELVGRDNRPIILSPSQRRIVDDALDDLALVEAHNAQVAAGVHGWAQREFMERRAPINRIAEVAPPVAQALNARLAQEGVLPITAAAQMWDVILRTERTLTPRKLSALATRARMDSGSERRAEVRRLGVEAARNPRKPRNLFAEDPQDSGGQTAGGNRNPFAQ